MLESEVKLVANRKADAPVGIVVTDWFSLSLYRMAVSVLLADVNQDDKRRDALVFPAASSPNINNLISLLPKSLPRTASVTHSMMCGGESYPKPWRDLHPWLYTRVYV